MLSLTRTTPSPLRHLVYALHHASGIARGVTRAPWLRSSWGLLLNLPRFGIVVPGRVYRSGSPRSVVHFRQILDLGIKTVICVRRGGPDDALIGFARDHQIELRIFDLDHDGQYDVAAATLAARAALVPPAQPALVCCEGGRHHAGVVIALLRLSTGHTLDDAIAEYYSFAAPSPFPDNVLFIVRAANAYMKASHERSRLRSMSDAATVDLASPEAEGDRRLRRETHDVSLRACAHSP